VGFKVGLTDGLILGLLVGIMVGDKVGMTEGLILGLLVGIIVGDKVGMTEGLILGLPVGAKVGVLLERGLCPDEYLKVYREQMTMCSRYNNFILIRISNLLNCKDLPLKLSSYSGTTKKDAEFMTGKINPKHREKEINTKFETYF
jgi:hypothetical protein